MKNESQAPIRELKTDHEDIYQKITQSASNANILPENLPGIDIENGLQRMGENKVLYKNLLIRFYEYYGNSARRIRNYLEQGEAELARQLSHTIKGISGNLSIDQVYHSAIVLEAQLKSGDAEKAGPLMDQFETALKQVNEALQALKRKDDIEQTDQADKTVTCEKNVGCEKDFSKIQPWLDELGTFLKENNLEAERCLEALRKELHGTKALSAINELKNQIDFFDFSEARKTYKKLMNILEEVYNH